MKPTRSGFSLLEVVVAAGVLALTVIALLAFMVVSTGAEGATADAQTAAALGGPIQAELERLRTELGLEGLAAAVPPAGSPAPLRMVAARDGHRALCADGAAPAADHPLNDPGLPGIARRDRYFLVEITRQVDLPDAPESGLLAVNAIIRWPYQLPTGPATPGAAAADADGAREVPAPERSWLVLGLAVPP